MDVAFVTGVAFSGGAVMGHVVVMQMNLFARCIAVEEEYRCRGFFDRTYVNSESHICNEIGKQCQNGGNMSCKFPHRCKNMQKCVYLQVKLKIEDMKTFWKVVLGAFLGTILALVLLMVLGIGALGSIAALSDKEVAPVAKSSILKIDFSNGITEQGGENFSTNLMTGIVGMSDDISLYNAVKAIDAAATDPAIKFIYMNLDNFVYSSAIDEELREALVRFRQCGKAIIAYSNIYTGSSYYMASVADKVILNTFGECSFEGISTQMFFLKDIIDRLGVDVQLVRHGKYKSAGEPFIRNDISEENRAQYEVLLGSLWNSMATAIAQSRDFSVDDLNCWIDNLSIDSAQKAKDLGIVDELWYADQVEDYLCDLFGVDNAKDLSFVTLKDYVAQKVKTDYRVKEKIAILYADGEIAMDDKADGNIGARFAKEVAKVRKDSTIKAVVLRVNSPGGEVQSAAVIKRELDLLQAEKPVIASYGEYAASGGYWISAACDKIYSDRSTMTGSIGVFGLIPSFGRAIKKNLHINLVEVSTHKHGTVLNGIDPLDEQEYEYVQGSIENIYTEFTSLVADGRSMSVEAVDEIGQGRVWAGADAVEIGLVDEIGGLSSAIEYAALSAGLEKYQVVGYPAAKSMQDRIMEMISSGKQAKAVLPEALSEFTEPLRWIEQQQGPAIMARMPYSVITVR